MENKINICYSCVNYPHCLTNLRYKWESGCLERAWSRRFSNSTVGEYAVLATSKYVVATILSEIPNELLSKRDKYKLQKLKPWKIGEINE